MRSLLAGLVLVAAFVIACGSGDDPPRSTATQTSQRAEREATVSQQQRAQLQPEQSAAAEQPQPDAQDDAQTEPLPTDAVGEHKGLRSQRNLLGEPDAPVLIEYYGDFT